MLKKVSLVITMVVWAMRASEVPALAPFLQFQVLLRRAEEHFDVPALAVNADNVFIGVVLQEKISGITRRSAVKTGFTSRLSRLV